MRRTSHFLPVALAALLCAASAGAQVTTSPGAPAVDSLAPSPGPVAAVPGSAAAPAALPEVRPAQVLSVTDFPNDAGDHLQVAFQPSPDSSLVLAYQLERRTPGATDGSEDWAVVAILAAGEATSVVDGYDPDYPVQPGVHYDYRVDVMTVDGGHLEGPSFESAVVARGEWYNTDKTRVLVACSIFMALIFYYFSRARRGASLYLRPIAGIDAIDEAIGRATEMGKPILYVPGLSDISDVATIASLTILGRVARKVAEYQTPLMVPNRDPIVYTVAEESVKQAYLEAGRPDTYDPNSVFFVTDSQFAYVAAVNGLMTREKPATNFYLGMFWAESLLLAETGSLSGAIQIAGTDAITQLPFFITTCDYTLIGEELYAASAYLGREPKQVGAVKGQDACKGLVMFLFTAGIVLSIADLILGTVGDPSRSLIMKLANLVTVGALE